MLRDNNTLTEQGIQICFTSSVPGYKHDTGTGRRAITQSRVASTFNRSCQQNSGLFSCQTIAADQNDENLKSTSFSPTQYRAAQPARDSKLKGNINENVLSADITDPGYPVWAQEYFVASGILRRPASLVSINRGPAVHSSSCMHG